MPKYIDSVGEEEPESKAMFLGFGSVRGRSLSNQAALSLKFSHYLQTELMPKSTRCQGRAKY